MSSLFPAAREVWPTDSLDIPHLHVLKGKIPLRRVLYTTLMVLLQHILMKARQPY